MTDQAAHVIPDEDDFRALLQGGVLLTPELAFEALDVMLALRIPALRYSIWLKRPDGEIVPSLEHEGASGSASAGIEATYAYTRLLIEHARVQHASAPEIPDSLFLVFLTTDGADQPIDDA